DSVSLFFFFFSSRRRHTRSLRDWSSDVCSSDLVRVWVALGADPEQPNRATQTLTVSASADELFGFVRDATNFQQLLRNVVDVQRSEERRVGKECRARRGRED